MFYGIGSSLVFQCPGLRSPTSRVQAYPLSVAPRLHRLHSTEDKTPRLMVKQHLTAKNTQRTSQTHSEEIGLVFWKSRVLCQCAEGILEDLFRLQMSF